jgi:hypothetical protein
MALNLTFDVSFDNMQDGKGTREREGEVNSMKLVYKKYWDFLLNFQRLLGQHPGIQRN